MFPQLKVSNCIYGIAGSVILAFGLYNVHSVSGVTEGGILGMTLLLDHWFALSPAVTGFIMNFACYLLGWKLLGKEFIAYSAIFGTSFSVAYAICELGDPLWPQLAYHPLAAAIIGALFVGIGVGLAVRAGGAPGGDDALALSLAHVFHCNIENVYLFTDLIVLVMSISYIPLTTIGYSLLTVMLSGALIGVVQRIGVKDSKADEVGEFIQSEINDCMQPALVLDESEI